MVGEATRSTVREPRTELHADGGGARRPDVAEIEETELHARPEGLADRQLGATVAERLERERTVHVELDADPSDHDEAISVIKEREISTSEALAHAAWHATPSSSSAQSPRDVRIAAADDMGRERLCRYITETNASITAVALDVGCSTPQHLSTLFKKYVGETPTGWRTRNIGGRDGG